VAVSEETRHRAESYITPNPESLIPNPWDIIQGPVSIEATIQRAADGDQAAWDTIVQTYWRKVFNVAYRFVGTYEEAEDLTQEIFLKVFRSLGTFDRRANFQTWLISVSRNFCIDRYRSGRRDREVFAREVDASTVQAEAPGMNAQARVELHDRVALLREALRALSPPLRTAVLLRDVHELSYQEIAEQLGVAEGTVKSRINRGRAELARQIEALWAKTEGVSK
jgi:RNA polymerase sigma-70 factor (ECF subfamily)